MIEDIKKACDKVIRFGRVFPKDSKLHESYLVARTLKAVLEYGEALQPNCSRSIDDVASDFVIAGRAIQLVAIAAWKGDSDA